MAEQIRGSDNLEIRCPCCTTRLVVHPGSGEILHQERPKAAARSWEDALRAGRRKQAEAEELFARGMDRERNADSILQKKFEEALKRADKSDTPPPRIFDLD